MDPTGVRILLMPVTASNLYDYVHCPHRVTMDLVGDPSQRDPVSPFIELLWERGNAYESEVITRLSKTETIVDLSSYKDDEKERRTLEAIRSGADLIYSGRISSGDLVGIPDLLKRVGEGYVPVDIKSGRGEEGGGDDTDPKPKLHYAVQLALYVDILEQLGLSAGRYGLVLDINEEEVRYDLSESRGPKKQETLWQEYQEALSGTREIYDRKTDTLPAYSGICKLCHWYSSCLTALRDSDDLTLIPRLGRAARDTLADEFPKVSDLAERNPDAYVRSKNKTVFTRIGAETLRTYHERAKLLATPDAKPYLKKSVRLPSAKTELFFDIEADPMRDICYLHGFVIREDGDTDGERFIGYFADEATPEDERAAFQQAIDLIRTTQPNVLYYYSKYERTWYRKLQSRYPDVCTADEIENLFDPSSAVDLYNDVVLQATEWPTNDHSIKTLAKYLGSSGATPTHREQRPLSGMAGGYKPKTRRSRSVSSPIMRMTVGPRVYC